MTTIKKDGTVIRDGKEDPIATRHMQRCGKCQFCYESSRSYTGFVCKHERHPGVVVGAYETSVNCSYYRPRDPRSTK